MQILALRRTVAPPPQTAHGDSIDSDVDPRPVWHRRLDKCFTTRQTTTALAHTYISGLVRHAHPRRQADFPSHSRRRADVRPPAFHAGVARSAATSALSTILTILRASGAGAKARNVSSPPRGGSEGRPTESTASTMASSRTTRFATAGREQGLARTLRMPSIQTWSVACRSRT